MKKSKNTKGLVGSVDYIDSDELVILRKKIKTLESQLDEARAFIEKYGEFRNALSRKDKLKLRALLVAIYLQLKENEE